MNIITAGDPLLIMSQAHAPQKGGRRVSTPGSATSDTIVLSQIPDKALLKYREAVDHIVSDLMRIVDAYAAAGLPADDVAFPGALTHCRAMTGRDTCVYFPGPAPGESETRSGQVVVIGNGLSFSDGARNLEDEEIIRAMVKVAAQKPAAATPRIGLRLADIESIPVRDRFILFTETKNDVPVVSIIRQKASGRSEPVTGNQVPEADIQDVITKIREFITEQVNLPQVDGQPEKALSEDGPVKSGLDRSLIPVAPADALADAIPGITVRYVHLSPPSPDVPAGTDPRLFIVDKLASLGELIEGMSGPSLVSEGGSEDDRAALRETISSAHEQITTTVRQALSAASRDYRTAAGPADQGFPGAGINEDGTLRIDRVMLVESLSAKKEETVTFIRDFGRSLQDGLRYDFNPLAGVYAGGRDAAGITGAGRKDRAGDDNDKQKARLEERLNRVQLLLRSSYELKDVFMQSLSLNNAGPGDETDR